MNSRDLINGITFGAFDLCHAGHVAMFETCKQHCDYLIVGLQTDPSIERKNKNKPVQSLFERYTQLRAVRFIDEIIPYTYEHEIEQMLQLLPVRVRIIGEDYQGKDFTGKQLCIDSGIDIIYNSRKHVFSSSELRTRLQSRK